MKDKIVFKNFFILFSGNILAQAIPFLVSPILSRIYSPEDFGAVSVFLSVIGVLSVFTTFQYENALYLINGLENRKNFLQFLIFMLLISTIAITIFIYTIYLVKGLDSYYLIIPFGLFFYSATRIFEVYSNSIAEYKLISKQKLFKGLVENSTNLFGVIRPPIAFLMCYSVVFSFFATTIYYFNKLSVDHLFTNIFSRIKVYKFFIVKYRRFLFFTFPHVLLNSLNGQLLYLLIPYYYGNQVGGLLSFGLKYIQFPLSLISASLFGLILQNTIDKIKNRQNVRRFLLNFSFGVVSISLLYGLVVFYSREIFLFIFGNNWIESYNFIVIILPFIIFNFIISVFSFIPLAINKQNHGLGIEILSTISKLIPFGLFFLDANLNISDFLKAFNIVNCISMVIIGYWLYYILRKSHEKIN
jgi:O-antigen/teichoic acid export membrane protein